MNTTWQASLAASGARFDNAIVTDFGNPAEELIAARDATVMAPLSHLALIECSGEDASSFLHNQLTSDVNHLAENTAQHSAWCTHKGRMQASFLLFRHGSGFRALVSADLLEPTLKRLQMFVLRSKVRLADVSNDLVTLGISGNQAVEALKAAGLSIPEEMMGLAEIPGGTLIRLDPQRFILIASAEALSALLPTLGNTARLVGTPAWQWLDIQAGIVLVSAATKEEFVPQMVNFDKIGGVSFRKGCYPGQEVVARTQYLGKIKRHLYLLRTEGPVAAGTDLFPAKGDEQACGVIANATPAPGGGYAALAVIKESAAESEDVDLKIPGVVVTSVEAVVA